MQTGIQDVEAVSSKGSSCTGGHGAQLNDQSGPEQAALKLFAEAATQQPLEHLIAEVVQKGFQLDKAIEQGCGSIAGVQDLR